jgi:hypothetical protein
MDNARPQSQFLINEKMTMPADAVAITGGSISVCSLTAQRNSRCAFKPYRQFHPSMRQNATVFGARSKSWIRHKPVWSRKYVETARGTPAEMREGR